MDNLEIMECVGPPKTPREKITLKVENLAQDYVGDAVEDVLKFYEDGISNLVMDRCNQEISMECNPNFTNLDGIKETINQLGYKVEIRREKL